jgi:uncharacterized membrane protein
LATAAASSASPEEGAPKPIIVAPSIATAATVSLVGRGMRILASPELMIGAMLYLTLKFVHVLLAIVAVGFNVAYGLIIGRARRAGPDGRELRFALKTVKLMDDYVANPCYGLLLVTGAAMVWVSGMPWSLKWVHMSMGLWVVMALVAALVYTPTLRKQIAVLEARGPQDPEFRSLSKRGGITGGILAVIVLVIIWLMVTKPA